MRRLFKTSAKSLAYTLFFLVALAFFIYQTLPLDQVQAYLVRKAADEHNLDLEIAELSTAGVAGIEMKGVLLSARPTAEERELLNRARERRRQWELAKGADKAEGGDGEKAAEGADGTDKPATPKSGAGKAGDKLAAAKAGDKAAAVAKAGVASEAAEDDAAEGTGAEGKPGGEATAEAGTADGSPGAGKPGEGKAGAGKPGSGKPGEGKPGEGKAGAKALAKAADDPDAPPPLPSGPQPVLIDRVAVRLSPLQLLRGNVSGSFELEMLGGQAEASLGQSTESMRIDATWSGLALEQLPFFRTKLGVPLTGALAGRVALDVPRKTEGAGFDLANITGDVEVNITDGQLGPAPTVPQGSALHEALAGALFVGMPPEQVPAEIQSDLPKVRFTRYGGSLTFAGGKAELSDFTIDGPDLVGDMVGHILLASQFSKWAPRLHQRFKFTEAFLKVKENQSLQSMLQSTPKVRLATDAEGFIGLQFTGFVTQPKPAFTKHNSVRPRVRPGAAADPRLRPTAPSDEVRTTKGRALPERPTRLNPEPTPLQPVERAAGLTLPPAPPREKASDPVPAEPTVDPTVAAPGEPILDVPEPEPEVVEPVVVEPPVEEPLAPLDDGQGGDLNGDGEGGDALQGDDLNLGD